MIVEACVDSVASAISAQSAGAGRIELNCALQLDGLTPSIGLLERVREAVQIPIICMVRSRAGDFCYSDDDWMTMKNEIRWLLDNGADGLAFGALNDQRTLDIEKCQAILDIARSRAANCELVFHKAFDVASNWRSTMDDLVRIGFDRIMTSGQAAKALEGLEELQSMVQEAGERIEILPAGGIRSDNAALIVEKTGCRQVHGSFRRTLGPFDGQARRDFESELGATVDLLKRA